jgi:acyl carrier protein
MLDVELAVLDSTRELRPGPASVIVPETSFEELSLDSLEMLELKMRLEEKFDIELDVAVFEGATTLRDLACNIANLLRRPSDVRCKAY